MKTFSKNFHERISKMIKRTICVILTLAAITTPQIATTYTAYAAGNNPEWVQTESGKLIRQGGINSIDGVKCKTKGETIALENSLRKDGYIQVSGKDMDITEKEFNLFCRGKLAAVPYAEYTDKKDEFNWAFYKIYVYKPCFEDAMKQIKAGDEVSATTRSELGTSVVVIDYGEWYQKERIGKVVNEYNDNIPSWCKATGFLQITSPIDIIIRIEHFYTHTFDELYVRANKPLLVKLREGAYIVRKVNATDISEEEKVLPFKNNIQIQTINTETEPYKIDLEKTVDKYKIAPINLDGKPDCSYKHEVFFNTKENKITTKSATVKGKKEETSHNNNLEIVIVVGTILALCAFAFGIYKFKKK